MSNYLGKIFHFSPSNSDITNSPDFNTVFASQRFFVSSPGPSNSIINSKYLSEPDALICGGLPITTYSSDPYNDFRLSMQEMVEARGLTSDVRADCDYLHELLFCYLALNPNHTHKFIVAAFSDLIRTVLISTKG